MTEIVKAIRSDRNPLIFPSMLRGEAGLNINGPCLIRVPEWMNEPLGRYYLYFAHHKGTYIRMAYADQVEGPYTVYHPGVLHQRDTIFGEGEVDLQNWTAHIASPEVIVDHDRRQLVMIFHGLGPSLPGCHGSSIAASRDGLTFAMVPDAPVIPETYFRAFRWMGHWYLIGRLGQMYRTGSEFSAFERGPNPFQPVLGPAPLRHCAVRLVGARLQVFYSRIGDEPERIVLSEMALDGAWERWAVSHPTTVLQPETIYEGVDRPLRPSRMGPAWRRVREVRDPAIFEEDGHTYLLYSIAGESGIAVARLQFSIA
ncbi:MAG: hypothetical protein R3330_06250 [Saprospiraceae bacterium]|nr:hypothetical protein [Saprospiraceae bacterium]